MTISPTMSFKLKKRIPIFRIFWLIVLFLIVSFCTKVWLWEQAYKTAKVGAERPPLVNNITNQDNPILDETEPTPDMVASYTVAPDRPRYLSIPALKITNAKIIPVGRTHAGAMGTPTNIFDTGWYTGSDKPGTGGTMIIDGHNGGPTKVGVFKYLPDLALGEIIVIERGDGQIFNYQIVENKAIPLEEADAYMDAAFVSPESGKESLTLITCSGVWDSGQSTYLSRQFIRAVLVE